MKLFFKSILTKERWHDIIIERCKANAFFGGIAQLARAFGSYPEGRGFKSNFRYQPTYSVGFIRPGGQAAKTPPFHGGNTSSILVRVTIASTSKEVLFCFVSVFYIENVKKIDKEWKKPTKNEEKILTK